VLIDRRKSCWAKSFAEADHQTGVEGLNVSILQIAQQKLHGWILADLFNRFFIGDVQKIANEQCPEGNARTVGAGAHPG
jgi:hypothetical protein